MPGWVQTLFPSAAFQTEGKLYLILDFLRGGDLFTRLSKEVTPLRQGFHCSLYTMTTALCSTCEGNSKHTWSQTSWEDSIVEQQIRNEPVWRREKWTDVVSPHGRTLERAVNEQTREERSLGEVSAIQQFKCPLGWVLSVEAWMFCVSYKRRRANRDRQPLFLYIVTCH